MLFAEKLRSEAYEPWKKHYIAYDQLKKLLKESATSDEWTEEDESRFVQQLDTELDKVYGFETDKFEEISKKLSKIESQIEQLDSKLEPRQLEGELEDILDNATELDRFRRINYTGFSKLVRKHDRIHSQYHVGPLLQARLHALPFHSEDYSPLLRRLSHIYTFLDEQSSEPSSLAKTQKLNSVDRANHSRGYVTLQFWVHPDNLMEVKTRILRRLPVLVYNREDDEDESGRDPTVTSLYLDNSNFQLYEALLERKTGDDDGVSATSLRFRWYGHLYEKPEIVLEQHNELNGQITRVSLKEKMIDKFLQGDKSIYERQARKMRERHVKQQAVDEYTGAAAELQDSIRKLKLEPMLRTVYKRTAFEIPGDDRVRVILDQDIMFMREDALNKQHPIRNPTSWHRADLDQPGVNISNMLRKGEFARFPYSVLEVRLRADAQTGINKLPWVEELQASKLIKEVPHFTKFLQGIAVLYGEDDRLDSLPFWLNDLDTGKDAESQQQQSQQQQEQQQVQDQQSTSEPQAGPSDRPPKARRRIRDYKFDDDDDLFDSEDSGILDETLESPEATDEHTDTIGYPTRVNGKISDGESEDDEVDLPPGVERPNEWIKNQTSLKIEAKVWLANERTFNRWLHVTCLLSALTFTLYSSVSASTSPAMATLIAYLLFALTLFTGLWGYVQYLRRIRFIKERGAQHMDSPFGPIIISIVLLVVLVINFLSLYSTKAVDSILAAFALQ